MLDRIEIRNFKAIQNSPLELTGLTNVNYLVGKNGSGKSSILEAIFCIGFQCNGSMLQDIQYKEYLIDNINNSGFNLNHKGAFEVELAKIVKDMGEEDSSTNNIYWQLYNCIFT